MEETIKEEVARWRELLVAEERARDVMASDIGELSGLALRLRGCIFRAVESDRIAAAYRAAGNEDAESVAASHSLVDREEAARLVHAFAAAVSGVLRAALVAPGGGQPPVRKPRTLEDYRLALDVLSLAGIDWK